MTLKWTDVVDKGGRWWWVVAAAIAVSKALAWLISPRIGQAVKRALKDDFDAIHRRLDATEEWQDHKERGILQAHELELQRLFDHAGIKRVPLVVRRQLEAEERGQ